MPLASGDWGDERSAWLVELSITLAIVLPTLLVLAAAWLFRTQILWLLDIPLRYTRPLWRGIAVLVAMVPPAQRTFRRYLYTGRHLATV